MNTAKRLAPRDAVNKVRADNNGQVVLVLQGGGALGAYQGGVYEALHEAGVEDWDRLDRWPLFTEGFHLGMASQHSLAHMPSAMLVLTGTKATPNPASRSENRSDSALTSWYRATSNSRSRNSSSK